MPNPKVAAYRLGSMGLQTVMMNGDDAPAYYGNALKLVGAHRILREYSMGDDPLLDPRNWNGLV